MIRQESLDLVVHLLCGGLFVAIVAYIIYWSMA